MLSYSQMFVVLLVLVIAWAVLYGMLMLLAEAATKIGGFWHKRRQETKRRRQEDREVALATRDLQSEVEVQKFFDDLHTS